MDTTSLLLRLAPGFIRRKIEHRKELRKILDNINWLTGEKVLRLGLGIFISALVARYLGPEKFGMMNFAVAFVGLFVAFNKLGLDDIVVRNIVKNPGKTDKYLGSALVLRLLGSLLLLLFAVIGIKILRPESTLMLVFVVIVSLMHLFKSFETIDLWFRSQVRSKYTVYSRTIAFVVISGLKLLFVLTQQPLIAFVMMFALDGLIAAIFLITFYQMQGEFSILKWKARFETMKELLRDSWPLLLSGMAISVGAQIDKIMIGSFLTDLEVGLYSAGVKLNMFGFLAMIIVNSFFPKILSVKNKRNIYIQRWQKLISILVALALAIALTMSIASPFLIALLYGDDYKGAIPVLSVMVWGNLLAFFGIARSKFLVAENFTKYIFAFNSVGILVNIILNFFLIPFFGIMGAVYSTLISSFTKNIILSLILPVTRHLTIRFFKGFNLYKTIQYLK